MPRSHRFRRRRLSVERHAQQLAGLGSSFYEAGPEFVKKYTEEGRSTVAAPVYSGLYVAPLSDAQLADSIETAIGAGAAGVSIFDAGAMNTARWKVFASAVGSR